MEAQRGPRIERDFAQGGVLVDDVDCAELVEVEPKVRLEEALKHFGAEINIFGPDEIADAGALVALLHLVPPAVDLVAHHARFIDEENGLGQQLEQMAFSARHAGEEFPARKDGYAARSCCLDGKLLSFGFCALAVDVDALAAEACVYRGE